MKVTETEFTGLLIIEPDIYTDSRGYFFESYNFSKMKDNGILTQFVQDNQSKSEYGVVRGLHYQVNPFSQAKLVRVIEGTIFDVAVDLREGSSTFGKSFGIEMSSENNIQLMIPKGCAHGFSVLSKYAIVFYKCDVFYNPSTERGIRYDDPDLCIDWHLKTDEIIVSKKDAALPFFRESVNREA
jgi:dTDP-4-dehydrorhamnose 3,5-epimerase